MDTRDISNIENLKSSLSACYCPYSQIKVGAMLQLNDGRKFMGVNVENASIGLTICAERSAFVSALSNGITPIQLKEKNNSISLYTDSLGTIIPCGACLQFMSEFVRPEFKIITCGSRNKIEFYTLKDLAPLQFKQ